MTRRVSVLGSTGSIGCNTVSLIAANPEAYDIVALTGGRNVQTLAEQARRLKPEIAVIADETALDDLRAALEGTGIAAAGGSTAVTEAASRPADWVMSAIVGAAGLAPGLEVLGQGATLALANKETMVAAGPLVMAAAKTHGGTILPVDSEHSAIFQALVGEDASAIERVIITASGGAFRDWSLEDLPTATLAQASSHPNWDMGQRITIDSASMFNKALEVIEAKELFGFDDSQIEVLIHPESIVHALVGFSDGGLMAHVGPPDMRHAIGYALHWPDRKSLPVERVDLAKIGALTFADPDLRRYPALGLAREVMQAGGLSGAVFNGAKEEALDGFIEGRIGFVEMAGVVEETLENMTDHRLANAAITLDDVLETDHLARRAAGEAIAARQG